MIDINSNISVSITGRVRWKQDGEWSEVKNKTQEEHIPSVAHAMAGNEIGHLQFMGAGTSDSNAGAGDLENMTSAQEDGESIAIQPVVTRVVETPELDGKLVDDVSAVVVRGQFGDESPQLNDEFITEMGLFAGDRNLFARRVLPEQERPKKIQGMRIEFEWTIFYGVEVR